MRNSYLPITQDLGAHNVPKYFEYLFWRAGVLASVCTLWLLALVLSGTESDPAFTIVVFCVGPPIYSIGIMGMSFLMY